MLLLCYAREIAFCDRKVTLMSKEKSIKLLRHGRLHFLYRFLPLIKILNFSKLSQAWWNQQLNKSWTYDYLTKVVHLLRDIKKTMFDCLYSKNYSSWKLKWVALIAITKNGWISFNFYVPTRVICKVFLNIDTND